MLMLWAIKEGDEPPQCEPARAARVPPVAPTQDATLDNIFQCKFDGRRISAWDQQRQG